MISPFYGRCSEISEQRIFRSKYQVTSTSDLKEGQIYARFRAFSEPSISNSRVILEQRGLIRVIGKPQHRTKKPDRIEVEFLKNSSSDGKFQTFYRGFILLSDLGLRPFLGGWTTSSFIVPQDKLNSVFSEYNPLL